MCGFIAQLVEHRTGIAEVMGSNPVEALIFFRLLFGSVMFGVCFFAVYTNGMLFAFVNGHRSPVKRNYFNTCTLFLTFALVDIMHFSLLVIEFFYNLAGIRRFLDIRLLRNGC